MKSKENKRTIKNKMIIKFLTQCGFKDVALDKNLIHMFDKIELTDMTEPMILKDRKEKNLTVGQLVIKYGLSERQIKYILYG